MHVHVLIHQLVQVPKLQDHFTHVHLYMYTFCSLAWCMYGTSHKKVSRVTQYVTLLNDYLFSTYNSITCVLRLMLSVHVHMHAYYEVRIR